MQIKRSGIGGKEFETLMRLNLYDSHARLYDPALIRFISIDPLCEKYYSISPYAYCLNNPVKYIDPNGEDVYMYFYVSGHETAEDDEMFWAAALTRATDMLKSGRVKEGDVYTIRTISELGELEGAVGQAVTELSPTYGETKEFGLWSHGALDGPIGAENSSAEPTGNKQMSVAGWGKIDFNWIDDGYGASAWFYGCRTGSDDGGKVTPWVQKISKKFLCLKS